MTDDTALDHFRKLIQIPTFSPSDSPTDWSRFDEFIDILPVLYPKTHAVLERETVAGYSLLYRWRGSEPGRPETAFRPTVLMAHYDVVAAVDDGWNHPPFAAELTGAGEDRLLWGRGTIDDKGAVAAILEAIEGLVADGVTPKRDVYLSFGHNEETSGEGARAIVELLRERGISPALVLDEGGAIADRIMPGVHSSVAVVGVSEKGTTEITLTVDQSGGHASSPPKLTATVRLARAITRLNRHPFPASLGPTNLNMIKTIGSEARGPLGVIFSHPKVFKPLLVLAFGQVSDETRAMIRTTTAVTQLNGSLAPNALAEQAVAVVSTRIAVGSSVAAALKHFRRVIRDPQVTIATTQANEPSPVSPSSGPAWQRLVDSIAVVHPDVVVSPYIQLGGSDSRFFTTISDYVYRFTPFELSRTERETLHARNERIRVATWLRGIGVYRALLTSA